MQSIDLNKLDEPFTDADLEWKVQTCGISNGRPWALIVPYVSNRGIMNRLDAVVGKANWRNDYLSAPCGGKGVMCGLSIRIGDEWVTKWDGADNTDIEPTKGGMSNSMKRAAVQWGIGRYLYEFDTVYADCRMEKADGYQKATTKDKQVFWWRVPTNAGKSAPPQTQSLPPKAPSTPPVDPKKAAAKAAADARAARFKSAYEGKLPRETAIEILQDFFNEGEKVTPIALADSELDECIRRIEEEIANRQTVAA